MEQARRDDGRRAAPGEEAREAATREADLVRREAKVESIASWPRRELRTAALEQRIEELEGTEQGFRAPAEGVLDEHRRTLEAHPPRASGGTTNRKEDPVKDSRLQQIDEAVAHVRVRGDWSPEVGVVLGTGLGALIRDMEVDDAIDYVDIPHFPISTVESHSGRLVFGRLEGRSVAVMQGRFHFYEGYSMEQVTFPIRVMQRLGVGTLVASNACGGMNPGYRRGDLMRIDDHINLIGDNPLRGPNIDELGPRFPRHERGRTIAASALSPTGWRSKPASGSTRGVRGRGGPNLETRAEYRFLRSIGRRRRGDEHRPEVIVARHAGMRARHLDRDGRVLPRLSRAGRRGDDHPRGGRSRAENDAGDPGDNRAAGRGRAAHSGGDRLMSEATRQKDYKDTLNLPDTPFPMRGNLPQREPETLARWREHDLYSELRRLRAGRERWVLPTAALRQPITSDRHRQIRRT
jgi:purine-nucleoside phosphorylase